VRPVAAKDADPGDDLVSRLVVEQYRVVAGHESTSHMTALSVLALLRHPEQLAIANADPASRRGAAALPHGRAQRVAAGRP